MGLLAFAFACGPALADAPTLKTPAPVIYLADNLDEKDGLGWCIDTLGRGFSEQLQVHSCKPQGGDVQFRYDADTLQIVSVAFPGKCATLSDPASETVPFGLLDCASNTAAQRFVRDPETFQFRLESDEALCLAAGRNGRSAGPFMSRDLILAPCAQTDNALLQWIVKEGT